MINLSFVVSALTWSTIFSRRPLPWLHRGIWPHKCLLALRVGELCVVVVWMEKQADANMYRRKTCQFPVCEITSMVCSCMQVNKLCRLILGHPHILLLLWLLISQGHGPQASVFHSLLHVWDVSQGNTTSKPRFGIDMFMLLLAVSTQQITMALLYEYCWKRPRERGYCSKRTGVGNRVRSV